MINQSTRYVVCLGLLAGSLAIATTARAEISVTGGRTSGDAAFFVPGTTNTTTTSTTNTCGCTSTTNTSTTSTPTSGGDTVLFDIRTRQLRLETSAGVTVNSRFTPTAGRLDATTGVPKGGETGQLQGLLSGRAFTAAGNPVFFQNVKTTLDFTLNSFAPDTLIGGTLISPLTSATSGSSSTSTNTSTSSNTATNTSTNTATNTSSNTSTNSTSSSAPPIFLPITGVTLSQESATSFEAKDGQLYLGKFEANLPDGSIALPSDYRFTTASTTPNLPPSNPIGGGNTKFKLEGKGEGTTTFVSTTGTNSTIDFDSTNSKTDFKVEGTNFKVEGKGTGPADFKLGGINSAGVTGNLAFTGDTKFKIEGQGVGSTEFDTATGKVGYKSTNSNTKFKIEVGANKLEGSSAGEAEINVGGIGIGSTGSSTTGGSTTGGSTTGGSTTGSSTTGGSTTGGSTTGGSTTGTTTGSTTTTGGASSGTSSGSVTSQTTYISLFTIDSLSTSQVGYVVSPASSDDDSDGNELEVRRNEGRGRGRRVARGRQRQTSYVLVGPSSRVFPGLVGLRQLPPESSTSTSTTESGTTSGTSTTGTTTTDTNTTETGTTGTTGTTSTDDSTSGTTTTETGTTGAGTTGTTSPTDTSTTGTGTSGTGTTSGTTSTPTTTEPSSTTPTTGTTDDSTTINFSSPAGTGTIQFTPAPSTNP